MKYLTKKDFDDPDFMIDHYKYDNLDEYIEANAENLINHKINQEDLYELSHLLLFYYVSSRDYDYQDQLTTIYYDLFRYIFKPHSQDYDDIKKIDVEISMLESELQEAKRLGIYDETFKYIKEESIKEIKNQKRWYEIDETIVVPDEIFEELAIEKLFDYGYFMNIIRKYAQDELIKKEYCN